MTDGIRRRLALGLSACLLLLAGCGIDAGGPGGAAGPVPIRVGWMFPGSDPLYVMQTHPELLAGNGTAYALQWTQVNGSSEVIQGIAAGTLDAGTVGSVSVLNGYEKGAEIALLAEMSEERAGWGASWYFARKDVTSVADLRGKKVGVNAIGSAVDVLVRAHLARHGLVPGTDFTTVAVPFPNMYDAVKSGDVALGVIPAPFDPPARADPELHVLFASSDIQSPFVQSLLGFGTPFVDAHRAAVASFMTDFRAATAWLLDPAHREAAIGSVASLTRIPAGDLGYLLDPARGALYVPPDGAISVDALQANWDFLHAGGAVPTPYKVTDVLDDLSSR